MAQRTIFIILWYTIIEKNMKISPILLLSHGPYVACQTPLSMGFQEYWSGLPFPSPGSLPNPEIKPVSPASPALAGGFFTTESPKQPTLSHVAYSRKYTQCCKSDIVCTCVCMLSCV